MSNFVSELNTIHPLDCLIVAQVRSECADFIWYYDHRYIRYEDGTLLRLREHQRVAQVAYGVLPDGNWHIHHIDRNRINNRANNLAVLSASEHMRLTASEPRAERVTLACPVCGAQFQSTAYRVEQRNKMYCSEPCRAFADRKVERPSQERLADLLSDIGNWSELGRMFGVTDNSVRKWARSYGLL